MDSVSFIYGFTDELEKRGGKVTKALKSGAGKAAKGVGRAGWRAAGAAAPWMLLGGVPVYLGAKALAQGFGRGVAEESDRRLPHER